MSLYWVQVFLKNRNKQLSRTVRPAELKRDCHPTLRCRLDFKLHSLLLQCSGRVQSQNGVDLVEVSIFYKSEKTNGHTVWPKKIKTVALLYLIMAT